MNIAYALKLPRGGLTGPGEVLLERWRSGEFRLLVISEVAGTEHRANVILTRAELRRLHAAIGRRIG